MKDKGKRQARRAKFRENLSEGIAELILTLVLFGIGYGIISLFGLKTEDFDLTMLIGIVAIAVIFAAVYIVSKLFKKKKRKNVKENTDGEDNNIR